MRAWTTVALAFIFFVSASTQGLQDDWSSVKALETGATLRIEQRGGHRLEGQLVSVDDAEITMVAGATTTVMPRQSVRQVDRVGRPVRKRAILGLLIGGGGGAIIGYSTAETNKGPWTVLMAAGWAAVGGLIGAVDGLRERDYRLIYLNPSP